MLDLQDLPRFATSQSRAITAENPTGEKGGGGRATRGIGARASRELGVGWKVSPAIELSGGETATLAEIAGPGVIRHIWLTSAPQHWRSIILRMYWDNEDNPSVEAPLGDFFACGWCERSLVNSFPIASLAGGGLNSYWPMPFRRGARITVENRGHEDLAQFFYQIDYSLEAVPPDLGYLHAQWRRSNPVNDGLHVLLDGVSGHGHYVGTYLAWQTNNNGWWGEGEVKFYLDGDECPTICGTGTEDYFGGAWAFEQVPGQGYMTYSGLYAGFHQVTDVDNFTKSNRRFGMYRWHILDPVRFTQDIRVEVQALGWRSDGRYLRLIDDIASASIWYQAEPHQPFPPLGSANQCEVV